MSAFLIGHRAEAKFLGCGQREVAWTFARLRPDTLARRPGKAKARSRPVWIREAANSGGLIRFLVVFRVMCFCLGIVARVRTGIFTHDGIAVKAAIGNYERGSCENYGGGH
jgi:hypothetical protein